MSRPVAGMAVVGMLLLAAPATSPAAARTPAPDPLLPVWCEVLPPASACTFACAQAHFVVVAVMEDDPAPIWATVTCGTGIAACIGNANPGQVDCMNSGAAVWAAEGTCTLTYGDRAICGDVGGVNPLYLVEWGLSRPSATT